MNRKVTIVLVIVAFVLGSSLIGGCNSLPSLDDRSTSMTLFETANTELGRAITPLDDAHPGTSGIYPLPDGRDAFAARIHLTHAAERTLDVQYYIWRNDMTGTLLFDALRAAADRGVRVRLLLDDNNTSGLDATLAALDAHPNIEVRLFNPFESRKMRAIGYLFDFSRLNRRMHNKSFTADNQATIIGGRNVGDEYFGAAEGMLFVDLDVLAVGPVVSDVSRNFDRYWASGSSYPVESLLPHVPASEMSELAAKASMIVRDPEALAYMDALRNSALIRALHEGRLGLEWAPTLVVSDDPAKGLGRAAPEALLPHMLKTIIGEPAVAVDLVSAYFVPTAAGVDEFRGLAQRGVKVRILTNALEATDVPIVHAGYAKRRKSLLEAGIALYELRRLSPDRRKGKNVITMGSSSSSLHSKTFAVDGARVFIGSFNFDPRSAKLNTEMGFIIDSPQLAGKIEDAFNRRVLDNAYQVHLSDTGELYWTELRDGQSIRLDTEPGTTFWQRAGLQLLSLLPIDWLL